MGRAAARPGGALSTRVGWLGCIAVLGGAAEGEGRYVHQDRLGAEGAGRARRGAEHQHPAIHRDRRQGGGLRRLSGARERVVDRCFADQEA